MFHLLNNIISFNNKLISLLGDATIDDSKLIIIRFDALKKMRKHFKNNITAITKNDVTTAKRLTLSTISEIVVIKLDGVTLVKFTQNRLKPPRKQFESFTYNPVLFTLKEIYNLVDLIEG